MDRYQQTFETWNKLVDLYQNKFMELDLYNDTYDRFCELIQQPDGNILEIGCGPGNVTRYLLSQKPGLKILATDVAPAMVARAKENNPSVETRILDCREINALPDKYDGIMCGFCMPYLSKDDCRKLIDDSYDLLHSGGVLYCSAIEGDYSKSELQTSSDGQHTVFMYYHEAQYLERYLKDSGFISIEIFRKQYESPGSSPAIHLILIACKP
jgi:2-polyprenyl-3-methyl-5-hydroxy-6-metoxy-1,4-benzoquinol methylase